MQFDTLPRFVSPAIRAFCARISPHDPVFIASKPSADAIASSCFDNAARKVERAGGSIEYGWAIWSLPGAYLEAEHHGVWRGRHDRLIDVSPQPNGARRLLFLPDPPAVYDPNAYRSNIAEALPGNPAAAEFIRLATRHNSIRDAYRAGGARFAMLRPEDQAELTRLQLAMRAQWTPMLRAAANLKR